jgi:hypothetical protein
LIGNLVGSVLTYYLGIKAGRKFILKYGKYILFKKERLEITENLFKRYGDRICFVGRLLPGIRTNIYRHELEKYRQKDYKMVNYMHIIITYDNSTTRYKLFC